MKYIVLEHDARLFRRSEDGSLHKTGESLIRGNAVLIGLPSTMEFDHRDQLAHSVDWDGNESEDLYVLNAELNSS